MKKVIGIFPNSNYYVTDDCFLDSYYYNDNYIKKIIECGAIPYLIPLCDNKVVIDSLKECDGLLIQGGKRIIDSLFETIDYFYKNDKPILGICLGMQALGMYSVNMEKKERILTDVQGHWPVVVNRFNANQLVHFIDIDEKSYLYKIIGKKKIEVNSVHKKTIKKVGSSFMVSARDSMGIIEGIEAKDKKFVIGVQFHPEVLDIYDNLFKEFINGC